MFVEIHSWDIEKYWDLSNKPPEELELLKTQVLPYLELAFRFPDGKYYRYAKP